MTDMRVCELGDIKQHGYRGEGSPSVDRQKEKEGCGSIGLYLDKRKNTDRGMEKKEKEPVFNMI